MNYRAYNRDFLKQWNERMSHSNVQPLYDTVVVSILKRQGVDIEYTPRNLYEPFSLYDALERYSPEFANVVDMNDPDVQAGRNLAFACFAKPSGVGYLKPVRLDGPASLVYHLLNVNGKASAGLTAYGMSKMEAFSIAMRKVPEVLKGKAPDPCLAGCRTQAGKTGRLVWMYPYVMTLIEGCIARPIIEQFLAAGNSAMAFGQRSAVMGMDIRKAASHNKYYVSMDASKFDTTVSRPVIRAAFASLRTWFDPDEVVGFNTTVKEVFDLVEDYFIYTPIVMPCDGKPQLARGKDHGVPSGSYFTQLVDSFANVCMVGTLSWHYHLNVQRSDIWVLGDDMLFFSNKQPDLVSYAKLLSDKYGMNMNVEKSLCGNSHDPIHFLGRVWYNGLPIRSFEEMVERAVAPESFRKYGNCTTEAAAVLHSYRNSAFVDGGPADFFNRLTPSVFFDTRRAQTGLSEFLAKEGLVPHVVSETLY